ncbi:hypothetical protein [Sphingosinicella sp. BN140058]|uniref:hypothetical protein n=1 Tax=Sphingosinicella sp. BN140058 TaxID=1892855 RepID=UPI0010125F8C|nr:hypothetical protein [Sphingosinicella sp. BN140058]QAY77898.1 hypothetical protein ETR14_16255 [Sphingosinicella sp. BN140058]
MTAAVGAAAPARAIDEAALAAVIEDALGFSTIFGLVGDTASAERNEIPIRTHGGKSFRLLVLEDAA